MGEESTGFPRSFGSSFFASPDANKPPAPRVVGSASSSMVATSMPAPLPASSSAALTLAQVRGSLLLPDIPNPDNGQWISDCGAYAFERACGYAATVCFLGKVAGVVGTDKEIEQARKLVKEAFAQLGNVLFGGSDDIIALREEQWRSEKELHSRRQQEWMIGPIDRFRTAETEAAHHNARMEALQTGDLSKLDDLKQLPRPPVFGEEQLYSDAYIDNLKQILPLERRIEAIKQKRKLLGDRDVGDVIVDYFKGLWDGIKKIYNELMENINKGKWKYGLCKASIDVGLFIFEEGVSLAIVAALSALGLAAAGVMLRFATAVVTNSGKAARRLADVSHIRLNLSFTRKHERGKPFDAHGTQQVSRDTDVKPRELTDDHKKLLDEDYQGNLDATPDANKPPARKKDGDDSPNAGKPGSIRERLNLRNIEDWEIALAGQVGKSAAHQAAREKLVIAFAKATGSEDLLKYMIGDRGGMNLRHPIRIVELPQGTKVAQWVNDHGNPGNWFDPTGKAHPSALGISPKDRMLNNFAMNQDGFAIESVARPMKVDWGVDKGYDAVGGAKQWFIPDKYKPTKGDKLGPTVAEWRDLEAADLYKIDNPSSKERFDRLINNLKNNGQQ